MHEITKTSPVKMPKIGQNMFENFFCALLFILFGTFGQTPYALSYNAVI